MSDTVSVKVGHENIDRASSLISLYRTMRTIRRFEERVVQLVNANEIAGVTHEYIGQEAVATGVCAALEPGDVITSTHRGHGHAIAKGLTPGRMFAELFGRISGTNHGHGGSMHIADLSLGIYGANGIVAAGAPWAAGAAWVAVRSATRCVAVSFFGDGAVNQGVLHETMNLAVAWNLPVVFICENNGYAVTTPSHQATAGAIVERAAAYGMAAASIDGMDVEVVLDAAREAVARGRHGEGPTFLECRTYRFVGHHTAERAMGLDYRTDEEIEQWRERDPLTVLAARIDGETIARLDAEVEQLLDEAIEFARAGESPDPSAALTVVYADGDLPRSGVRQ